MLIKDIKGREIFDSRGTPTVAVDITLENGITAFGNFRFRTSRWRCFDGYARRFHECAR